MKKMRFVIAVMCACTLFSAAASAEPLGIVTGPHAGTYVALGRDIAEAAKREGLDVTVKESQGSIDNIKRITSLEPVSVGIVQSDVLGFLNRSKSPDARRIAGKLRMIFPLGNEEVHVLARKDIQTFKDLEGKRVVVGTEGSGNMITSINLLTLTGVKPGKLYEISPAKGMVAVLNGQVDAMIFVGGKPVKMFKNLEKVGELKSGPDVGKLDEVHLIPLDDPRLLSEYVPARLTHEDYDYITRPVPTVAVTSILMDYDFSDETTLRHKQQCAKLAALARAIRDNIDWLRENGHPEWKQVNLDADVGFWKRDACAWRGMKVPAAKGPVSLERDLIGVIREQNLGGQ
jgi:TRAP transporter TAXI family solute receptor